MLKNGIYSISLVNEDAGIIDIYIGSTMVNFKSRFYQHHKKSNKNNMPHTYNLIKNGGIFEIVYIRKDGESEEYIRNLEQEITNQYINDKNYNVLNSQDKFYVLGKRNNNKYFKTTTIDIVNLLIKNNFNLIKTEVKNYERRNIVYFYFENTDELKKFIKFFDKSIDK